MTLKTTVRVRYPETDRMGVAYHGHYLVWFELGRTELMREVGCDYGSLEDREQSVVYEEEVLAVRAEAQGRRGTRVRSLPCRAGGVG